MRITSTRRLIVSAIGSSLLAVSLAGTPASAAPLAPAYQAAQWLDDQIPAMLAPGSYQEGPALDAFYSLYDLDTRSATRDQIVDGIDATAYTTFAGTIYPGASAKLALAVALNGDDPTSVDGRNLVTDIESQVDNTTGAASNIFSTISQTFIVRALDKVNSPEAAKALTNLLTFKCSNGGFDGDLDVSSGCSSDVDATAYAVRALDEVGDDANRDAAVTWLLSAQQDDGGFKNGGGTENANSTGLATTALGLQGKSAAAGAGAVWLAGRQANTVADERTALSGEIGAIAFNDTDLTNGRANGLSAGFGFGESRPRWAVATGQSAAALNYLPAAVTLTVDAPNSYVKAGTPVAVTATGLADSERVTFELGSQTAIATANSSGVATANVVSPSTSATSTVRATGSRATRTGTDTVTTLAAKTISVKPRFATVRRGTQEIVDVTGFAAGEKVTFYYAGKLLKTGSASSKGAFQATFPVGATAGQKSVVVYGMFATRRGASSFKVS